MYLTRIGIQLLMPKYFANARKLNLLFEWR